MNAVLFDLDGTLLENNFNTLLKAYFTRLTRYFSKWMEPEKFVEHLMKSMYVMINNKDASKTNIEVFIDDFFQRTGLDPKLMEVFNDFYYEEFPNLKSLAKPNLLAPQVVKLAQARGYKTVIATNPVFPTFAIEERLRWANVDQFSYDLITTGDNMHFCKPNVEYYLEIAELIGLAPAECLMIGDDPENDGPAAQIGMEVLLLNDGKTLADVQQRISY